MQPFEKVTKQERVALWVLRLSVLFYGFALTIFTIIGLRQMLR